MHGLHLLADLDGCPATPLMTDAAALQALCESAARDAGLTVVGHAFHAFAPRDGADQAGVTGTLLLAESHLAIHTWPERGAVTLDVYVCNLDRDNSAAAERVLEALVAAFAPLSPSVRRVMRGAPNEAQAAAPDDARSTELDLEWLNESAAFGIVRGPLLFDETSAHQRVRVFDTPQFGRALKIDARFMTSEADDFFYHEALVHPAALALAEPRRVFIAGGGDGGAAREALRHPGVQSVRIAELDDVVVRASREWLPSIHRGALDDARTTIAIGDALVDLQRARDHGEHFDLVLFDLTDPDTPAGPLYSRDAFDCVRDCMPDEGVFVVHLGSPTYHPDTVRDLVHRLRDVFTHVDVFGVFVPLYGCWWMIATASRGTDVAALSPAIIEQRLRDRRIGGLGWYGARQHAAMFVLPPFVETLLA